MHEKASPLNYGRTTPPMSLKEFQQRFLHSTIERGALKIGGEFKLKSGRISPYFFNAGAFNTGSSLAAIGQAFADAIADANIQFDMLFGPAYKGIPLVAAVSIAFAEKHGRDVPFAFNRKEAKDHGEGGVIVGSQLRGRVLLIDDVITAGTAIRESVRLLEGYPECELVGAVVALDRQERATEEIGSGSAIQSVEKEYGIRVVSIVNLDSVLALAHEKFSAEVCTSLQQYKQKYGV